MYNLGMYSPRSVKKSSQSKKMLGYVLRYSGTWILLLAVGAATPFLVHNQYNDSQLAQVVDAQTTTDRSLMQPVSTDYVHLFNEVDSEVVVNSLLHSRAVQEELQILRDALALALRKKDYEAVLLANENFKIFANQLIEYANNIGIYESEYIETIRFYLDEEVGLVIAAETLLSILPNSEHKSIAFYNDGTVALNTTLSDAADTRFVINVSDGSDSATNARLFLNDSRMWGTPHVGGLVREDMLDIRITEINSATALTGAQLYGSAPDVPNVLLYIDNFYQGVPVDVVDGSWQFNIPPLLPNGIHNAVVLIADDFSRVIAKSNLLTFRISENSVAVVGQTLNSADTIPYVPGQTVQTSLFYMVLFMTVVMIGLILLLSGYMVQARRQELVDIRDSDL